MKPTGVATIRMNSNGVEVKDQGGVNGLRSNSALGTSEIQLTAFQEAAMGGADRLSDRAEVDVVGELNTLLIQGTDADVNQQR